MDATILGWLLGGLGILLNLAVTTVVGILIKRWFTKHDEKQAKIREEHERLAALEKEQERDRLKQEMDAHCNNQVNAMRQELGPIAKQLNCISNGTLSGLRNDILDCYYRCLEKGYRNDWDYTNIHDLYASYLSLGGNSFVADVMDRFDKLPTKEQWEKGDK